MPNRIIKESICTSEDINQLSEMAEIFFYRLMVNCDDFGRMDGRPVILKAKTFPLREITVEKVEKCLDELVKRGMVRLYIVENKPYLEMTAWRKHQTPRAKKSKFPDPMTNDEPVQITLLTANEPEKEEPPPPIPTIPAEPSVIELPLNDNSLFPITQSMIDHWQELYPNANVVQELKKMVGWLESNKTRRKTKRGINNFITTWLSKEQDSSKRGTGYNQTTTQRQVQDNTNYQHQTDFFKEG